MGKQTSGIYIIVNTKNGRVYIGKSAISISQRWAAHRRSLNRMCHENRHLQNAWNKYGEKFFKFLVLEYCAIEYLCEREKYYIGIYKARGLAYNITDGGEGALGRIASIETRQKLSIANKNRPQRSIKTRLKMSAAKKGKALSPEHRAKISTALKGRQTSIETRQKLSIANKNRPPPSIETRTKLSIASMGNNTAVKKWVVITPNSESIEIINLKSFCKENDLSYQCMKDVADSKQAYHKGWKCYRA